MFILGEEWLFQVYDIASKEILGEIYLKYLGDEKKGMKMIGKISDFWKTKSNISGLYLLQGGLRYKIMDFDLLKSKIWLKEIDANLMVS
jgi:hypothetical protein